MSSQSPRITSDPVPPKGVEPERADAARPAPAHRGMIVRQAAPLNLEMPFGALDDFITPTADFFVRCHFPIPEMSGEHWRLRVHGEVERPLELNAGQLRALPVSTMTATLECAGNGRVFLSPKVSGTQWERGAVGNATWTGVLLQDVLAKAGVRADALEVILCGADEGEIEEGPRPGGKINYARSVPLAKATDDLLLAWQMNGQDLTPAHGFPLRAIVPGWYGMASVKWLSEIVVSGRPFLGYYQSVDYGYWQRSAGGPSLVPITEMQVKAQIARPGPAESIPAGKPYLIRGAAWSNGAEVVRVELSVDAGRSWHDTRLGEITARHAWRLWEYQWQVPGVAGKVTLMVRATDANRRTQPVERDADRGTYIINEVLGFDVFVQ